jgi:DNA-binding transcriptional ArsR family regulator
LPAEEPQEPLLVGRLSVLLRPAAGTLHFVRTVLQTRVCSLGRNRVKCEEAGSRGIWTTRENWGKRFEILRHLANGEARGEGAPSVREVAAAVGLRSKETAHKHLKKLEELGYVERGGG